MQYIIMSALVVIAQAEATIPTSDGGNTITFGTTVQPSEVSITVPRWDNTSEI